MLGKLIDRYFIKQPRLRRQVTRLLYGSQLVDVNLLGVDLAIHSELENGYLRAFRHTRMTSLFRDEVGIMINLATLIEDGSCFVDAGANIGVYSSVMARLAIVKNNFSILAFEADPRTFERLALNAARHGFRAENVALTENEGTLEFVRGAVSHVTTKAASPNSYSIRGETFSVGCRPLSSFEIPGSSIVIKIDVEGAEYEVLLGAKRYFEQERVKAVYFDGVDKIKETLEFLEHYNFRILDGKTLGPLGNKIFSLLAVRAKDFPQ
jgi:FkbM family methyltransferase